VAPSADVVADLEGRVLVSGDRPDTSADLHPNVADTDVPTLGRRTFMRKT
jgi:hypothetical protein